MAGSTFVPAPITTGPISVSHPVSPRDVVLKETIPPLRAGDRLSVEEFERRYEAMPDVNKAELINGVVYMPSSVSDDYHGAPHFDFGAFLGIYRFNTPGVRGGDNSTLKFERGRNRPQSDSLLRIEPECGGQTRTDERGYVVGSPELLAEIAYSSASYDLHDKKNAFRDNSVQEYVVWRVEEGAIDWFRLRGDQYVLLVPDAEGVIRSEVFPGLWLDVPALLKSDYPKVQRILQAGLASAEQAAFVAELSRRRQIK